MAASCSAAWFMPERIVAAAASVKQATPRGKPLQLSLFGYRGSAVGMDTLATWADR